MRNPPCPVTGEPAVRLIQWIKPRHLVDLWKYGARVDVRRDFAGVERFGLWESPTGLYFFDPMIEGGHEFYTEFYGRLRASKFMQWLEMDRQEFAVAARHILPGDRVLDVGCGFGKFRHSIPQARYTGLDPHFGDAIAIDDVHNQTLAEHLVDHAGHYDVACTFEVIEHLTQPARHFSDMVRVVRPGGLLIVGVPYHPSALTAFPNSYFNAPPHHLTWWTKPALTALAERHDTSVVDIEYAPWGPQDAVLYWMHRCCPIKCTDTFYRSVWTWHLAALIGLAVGRVVHAVRKPPALTDEGIALVLVARRRS